MLQAEDDEESNSDENAEEVDPEKVLKVLLVTYMRSGSTFLGSMLRVSQTPNTNANSHSVLEPYSAKSKH